MDVVHTYELHVSTGILAIFRLYSTYKAHIHYQTVMVSESCVAEMKKNYPSAAQDSDTITVWYKQCLDKASSVDIVQ